MAYERLPVKGEGFDREHSPIDSRKQGSEIIVFFQNKKTAPAISRFEEAASVVFDPSF